MFGDSFSMLALIDEFVLELVLDLDNFLAFNTNALSIFILMNGSYARDTLLKSLPFESTLGMLPFLDSS